MKMDEVVEASLSEEDEAAVEKTAQDNESSLAVYLERAIQRGLLHDVPAFGCRSYCEVNDVDGKAASWADEVHAQAARMAAPRKLTNRAYQGPNREIVAGMVMQYGDTTEPVGSDTDNMTVLILAVGSRNGLPIAQVCPLYYAWHDWEDSLIEPQVALSGDHRYAAMITDIRHVNCDAISFPHGIVRHEVVSGDDLSKVREALREAIRRINLAQERQGGGLRIDVTTSKGVVPIALDQESASRYKVALQALRLSDDAYFTMWLRKTLRADNTHLKVYGPDLGDVGALELVREEGESDGDFARRRAIEAAITDAIESQRHDDAVESAKRTVN